MLKIESVSKKFGKKEALSDVDLELDAGIYGLLGDNGAGKSTLMRLLVGVDKPTKGRILYEGEDISQLKGKYRDLLGYMPQEFAVFPGFTAGEFLNYMGALKGLSKRELKEKISRVLAFVNLEDVKDKKVSTFSGGMKRRVGIAQALLNDPKILILDEPTAGLDPGERIRFSNILSNMSKDKIILFSTHIISDIEAITKNIIILNDGKIRAKTTSDKLIEKMEGLVFEVTIPFSELAAYEKKIQIIRMRYEGEYLKIRYTGSTLEGARPVQANLEDYYILHRNEVI
ncbi:ABC transporter ATP-binding protein [Aedoeadaptatus acetigenes]|uniref:ABC transporter ATP-binding protein n=1 Tax=Aedoeadaptatus acetigenes TaxID=2981723 RepID=A0ABV1J850_9FIRM|nr:ABC transporter ATP-binding protein [Peptoniphilaceae bacterium]